VGYHEMHGTAAGLGNGKVHGLWFTSTVVYFGVVLVPTFLILYIMLSITIVHFISIFLSVAALFVMCFMAAYFIRINSDLYGVIDEMYADPGAWLTLILALLTPLILEMIWRGLKRDLRPSLTEILQERIRIRRDRQKDRKGQIMQIEAGSEEDDQGDAPAVERAPTSSQPVDDILTHEDENKFYSRKAHRPKGDGKVSLDEMGRPQSYADGLLSKDETLKRSVIRAMLRFRNLTGSTFDSAAEARFQAHDVMGSNDTKEKKHETDEPVAADDGFEDAEDTDGGGSDKKEKKK